MGLLTPDWEAFAAVVRTLDRLEIPYMVVGSVAASFHGLTRATHDVDLVVALRPQDVPQLVSALSDGFYVDEDNAADATRSADMFNAIHYEGGFKIDFWVLKTDEFSRAQFDRRIPVDTDNLTAYVASAEDTILSKLLWHKISPSERQLSDARSIMLVSGKKLDMDYLLQWARKLDLQELLNAVIEEE